MASVEGAGGFFFFGGAAGSGGASGTRFGRLLDRLEAQPTGDTMRVALSLRDGDERIRRAVNRRASTGVSGRRSVPVQVVAAAG